MSKDVQYKHLCESGTTSSVQPNRSSSFGTGEHHSKVLCDVAYGRLQREKNYEISKKMFSF